MTWTDVLQHQYAGVGSIGFDSFLLSSKICKSFMLLSDSRLLVSVSVKFYSRLTSHFLSASKFSVLFFFSKSLV